MPLMTEIRLRCLDIFLKYFEKLSMVNAVRINGMAMPAE
jgi:hypothetical protein